VNTGDTIKSGIPACSRTCLLSIFLCLLPLFVVAEVLSGLVVGVSDGDTIKVLDDGQHVHTIRLMGIDAPEKAQAFGQRSKHSLSDLIYRQQVSVQWSKRDKYGRVIGKVLTLDGADVCLDQITRGMAWHYKQYTGEQSADDRERYAVAEKAARESKIGLWQDETPVPPWVWRHTKTK
jgi:endonuclease YncB( thermonuclease family)